MVRYPHTGKIKWSDDKEVDENGNPVVSVVTIKIPQCRVQVNSGSKDLDYSAKVFCPLLEVDLWAIENSTFIYEGRSYRITQYFPFQKHGEIWLE